MKLYEGLPIYELVMDNETDGLRYISLVRDPAIHSNFLCFSDNERKHQFSIQNEEKRIVSGLAMRADYPIYRVNEKGEEFYVTFSKETIRILVEKFFTEQRTLAINLEHSLDVNDVTIIESYFIDESRGLKPNDISEAKDGDWYVTIKINNDNIWEEIKNGNIRAFSVEGFFDIKEMFNSVEQVQIPILEETQIKEIEELQEDIYDIISKLL